MRVRPTLLVLHRWVGLAFGGLLLLQAITGASVVFRNEINHAIHSDALTVVPAGATIPVQTLTGHVRELHPELTLRRIDFPQNSDEAFLFRLEGEGGSAIRYVSMDPYRGRITRDAPLVAWPAHWLFELHQVLLIGATGQFIVGIEAVALLLMAIVGPILWWPGRRGLRRSLAVSLRAGSSRAVRDLHRVGGLVVAIVLATTAVTAILVIWRTPIQTAVAHIFPLTDRPAPKVAGQTGRALLPLDTIVVAARAKYGDALVKSVRFPGGHGRVVVVYLQASGTTRPRATDQIWFDGYTGATLATYEAAALSPATTFLDWALPVHTGQALGLPGRIVFLLAAFGLQGLVVTGFLQWLKRARLRRRERLSTVLR